MYKKQDYRSLPTATHKSQLLKFINKLTPQLREGGTMPFRGERLKLGNQMRAGAVVFRLPLACRDTSWNVAEIGPTSTLSSL